MTSRAHAWLLAGVLAGVLAAGIAGCSPETTKPGAGSPPAPTSTADPAAPSSVAPSRSTSSGGPTTPTQPTEATQPTRTAPTSTPRPRPQPTDTMATATAPSPKPTLHRTSTTAPLPMPTLSGHRVVVLDPGHDGGNAGHPSAINKLVPAGYGRYKACNTVGTETYAGYAEHAFNWDVAQRVRSILRAHGVTVVMTRNSDTGVGPCVNVRAEIGNEAHADAEVSIHGDGSLQGNGFHVIRADGDPGGPVIAGDSERLSVAVHSAMIAAGHSPATYSGDGDGYDVRSDLGGLNLSTQPSIMIECGNMRDPGDAATMSSASGRQDIAAAIASGILSYLD